MIKPALSAEQVAVGYQRFLAENPSAKAEVDEIPQEEAEALGTTVSELRLVKTAQLLCRRAAELDIEDSEYLLRLSVENEGERQLIRQARKDKSARILGID